MLLSLQDDDGGSGSVDSQGVPTGSTVMNIPASSAETETKEESGAAGGAKDQPAKPAPAANTSSAAKAILEKYMRRPRG
jgi:hypothetical protein